MRLQAQASLALLALLVAASLVTNVKGSQSNSDASQLGPISRFTLSRLFDFASYKRLFNKSYSSLAEELMRQKLFWSRAFRALISASKYKTGQSKYYLAVNQMSDMTARELHKITNDANGEDWPVSQVSGTKLNEAAELQTGDFEQDLPRYVNLNSNDLNAEQLRLDIVNDELANLPIEELIENEQKVKLDEETQEKLLQEFPSASWGTQSSERSVPATISQWQRVEFHSVKSNFVAPQLKRHRGLREKFRGWRKGFKREPVAAVAHEEPAPDEVFVDLRQTKCFDLARFQGECGACYAFVMISILEWLHCMKTGELVKFSEQYIIDCGYENIDTLDGCNGGNPLAAANFVRNFGIELLSKWPYGMREHQCPHSEDTTLESTGYFNFPLDQGLAVHLDKVPEQLELGPLYVSLMVAGDFAEYGGGLHGFGCSFTSGRHAMTLVGHGRENGQEYWLLRNSYGPSWGEEGYYKLAKAANCIMPPQAYVYGTADQINETHYFEVNDSRDEALVRRHHDLITSNYVQTSMSFPL